MDLYFYAVEQQLADGRWTRFGVARVHPRRFTDGIRWNGEELVRRARQAVGVELDRDTLQLYGNCLVPAMDEPRRLAGAEEIAALLGRPTRVVEVVELVTDQERKMRRPDEFWLNAKAAAVETLAAEAVVAALTGVAGEPVAHDHTGLHAALASSRLADPVRRAQVRAALSAAPLPPTEGRRLETLLIRDHETEGHADEIVVARWEADAILAWAATVPGWDPLDPQIRTRDQAAEPAIIATRRTR